MPKFCGDIYGPSHRSCYVLLQLLLELGKTDLGQALDKHRMFDEESMKVWASQLVLVLQHMHRQHWIHRDIKPQNIILVDSKEKQLQGASTSTSSLRTAMENYDCRLADLGLSKHLESSSGSSNDGSGSGGQRTKSRCGTANYMAPEIITGTGYGKLDLLSRSSSGSSSRF